MTSLPPAGLVGRGIAAIGAVLMGGSLFLDAYEELSYWDAYRRIDVVVLVLAAVAIVLLLLSLGRRDPILLFGVGAIGAFGLGLFSAFVFELGLDEGVGAYVANFGSAAVVVGAAIALLPAILRGASRPQHFAFLPADAASDTAIATAPAAVTMSEAGWYPDPSGEARIRYWDGQAWTEQTQQ